MLDTGDGRVDILDDIEARFKMELLEQAPPHGLERELHGAACTQGMEATTHAEKPSEVPVGIEIHEESSSARLSRRATGSSRSTRLQSRATATATALRGAKSEPGDAKVLVDLVRTDRDNHWELAGDT